MYVHDFRFDIIYKQAVTSEDMFLQMGNKTNATSSCETMVVSVPRNGDVDLKCISS